MKLINTMVKYLMGFGNMKSHDGGGGGGGVGGGGRGGGDKKL